ncbi:DUF6912 family protein [Nocardioides sp.]|uniref:DUF6912 family protein n=1 Tax=Nocardioides sp. TaxID=35761 RepID=UPI002B26C62C|nr:hypothetical protein [Nocardioides sp.]
MTRVYLPTTVDRVRGLVASGSIAADPEPFEADGDDEAAEYAALMSAADASTTLIQGPGRRVVLVAEVADAGAPIALADLVAVHADVADRGVDADPDEDLAWFGVQEIDSLL